MNNNRFYIAAAVVIVLALVAGFIGFNELRKENPLQNNSPEPTNSSQTTQNNGTNDGSTAGATVTRDQLKENDGKDGSKCWIAIDGTVYDASNNRQWVNGEHLPSNGRARCGEDLTQVISQAPHGKEVLGELATVGALAD